MQTICARFYRVEWGAVIVAGLLALQRVYAPFAETPDAAVVNGADGGHTGCGVFTARVARRYQDRVRDPAFIPDINAAIRLSTVGALCGGAVTGSGGLLPRMDTTAKPMRPAPV